MILLYLTEKKLCRGQARLVGDKSCRCLVGFALSVALSVSRVAALSVPCRFCLSVALSVSLLPAKSLVGGLVGDLVGALSAALSVTSQAWKMRGRQNEQSARAPN